MMGAPLTCGLCQSCQGLFLNRLLVCIAGGSSLTRRVECQVTLIDLDRAIGVMIERTREAIPVFMLQFNVLDRLAIPTRG